MTESRGSWSNLLHHEKDFKERRKILTSSSWKYLIPTIVGIMAISCIAAFCFLALVEEVDLRRLRAPNSPGALLTPMGTERKKVDTAACARVIKNHRFDCHPENGASELSCADRGCCWNPIDQETLSKNSKVPLNYPYCYYPDGWSLYKFVNKTKDTVFWENRARSIYKEDVQSVRMDIGIFGKDIRRIKLVDALEKRWEPQLPVIPNSNSNTENPEFIVEPSSNSPGFSIRKSGEDGAKLLDTGGFIFADQFLQISVMLPNGSNVYGLGEHVTSLKLDTNWKSLTMFNKDQPPTENANLYGSHPFAMIMNKTGYCMGILLLNSNAMEIILQPGPAITYRSIGGVFDFYIFAGPKPSDVIRQYSEIVGKPFMPPYWSLGFHLCRFGYGSLEETKRVWNRTRAAGIPFDTQWNDLDYMKDNNDFSYDTDKFRDLPKFLEQLHEAGMHYIPLIDAAISASEANGSYRPFDEGIRRNVFVKKGDSDLPFEGKVWNRGSTVWPDFTNPDTMGYWHDMMSDMWHMFPYDGAWIDMNEPSNFYNGGKDGCEKNHLDNPVYVPNVVGNLLATKTLCMNAKFHLGRHYDVHNTYGTSEAVATSRALAKIRGTRPFVISRSTWVGHGFYAGHWSGDVYSSWHDMRMSVPQLLSFSLFQIPMMGADICGFDGNTTQSLCNRWSQLGAFYPFSRNHNSDSTIEQDPVAMGELVVKSTRKALMIRYRFLPYLYTLFFRAHMFGETVARPLLFEFTNDSATWDVDSQFLWGSSLMIVPVLTEGATQVNAYIPRASWYDFYDKKCIISPGKNYTLEAPLDTIPLLLRGGSILPAQTPGKTTTESRKNFFELLIAPDHRGMAEGELYWDDGDSLDSIEKSKYRWWRFNLENQTVSSSEIKPGKYSEKMMLGKVQVMGVVSQVNRVLVNGVKTAFNYDEKRSYLTVKNLQVDFTKEFQLSWE